MWLDRTARDLVVYCQAHPHQYGAMAAAAAYVHRQWQPSLVQQNARPVRDGAFFTRLEHFYLNDSTCTWKVHMKENRKIRDEPFPSSSVGHTRWSCSNRARKLVCGSCLCYLWRIIPFFFSALNLHVRLKYWTRNHYLKRAIYPLHCRFLSTDMAAWIRDCTFINSLQYVQIPSLCRSVNKTHGSELSRKYIIRVAHKRATSLARPSPTSLVRCISYKTWF